MARPAATTAADHPSPTRPSASAGVPPPASSALVLGGAIADAIHGQQGPRRARIGLKLAADVLHVRFDRAFIRLERDAMQCVEQLPARKDAAGRACERSEELELRRGELDRAVADAHTHARNVERD